MEKPLSPSAAVENTISTRGKDSHHKEHNPGSTVPSPLLQRHHCQNSLLPQCHQHVEIRSRPALENGLLGLTQIWSASTTFMYYLNQETKGHHHPVLFGVAFLRVPELCSGATSWVWTENKVSADRGGFPGFNPREKQSLPPQISLSRGWTWQGLNRVREHPGAEGRWGQHHPGTEQGTADVGG